MNLPLTDGCFFVDNSTMELITTCPRASQHYTIDKRELDSERAAFRFGTHIHHALAMTHTGHEENEVLNVMTERFMEDPSETEEWRNLDSAVKAIKSYRRHKHLHPFKVWSNGKPAIELTFAARIGDINTIPIIYTGRIDLIAKYDEGLFVLDHKTTSVLGDSWWAEQAVSAQYRGYCWAMKECLNEEPIGYVVNALGIRPSIVNATWDEATDGLVMPKGSAAKPVEFARQRFFTKMPKGQLEEWRTNLLAQIEVYFDYAHRGYFPMHRKWCVGKYGRCPYYNVCELPPESRAVALASPAFRDVTWSPLKTL